MKLIVVAGARPNFVKVAPLLRAIDAHGNGRIDAVLVDTGQHYDDAMAAAFFEDLRLPPPRYSLRVGSGSHAVQTATVMQRFEPIVVQERPDIVLVVGDVNSTVACALVAAKLNVAVAHVEAGLRSFDRTMPEELNRIVTDSLSDLLFTTEQSANDNLAREGVPAERIFFVGNVMIDSLQWAQPAIDRSTILARTGVDGQPYALVTLHRPANVDDPQRLKAAIGMLAQLSRDLPVLFPAHPRTSARLAAIDSSLPLSRAGAPPRCGTISLIEPLGYLDFLRLEKHARLVLTDSGGVQEETTCLGVPCVSMRDNTERPITVALGTTVIGGTDPQRVLAHARHLLSGKHEKRELPPLWDGHAAERIVDVLLDRCR